VALGIGPAFVAWWVTWLHDRTGLWNAWTVAQKQGWGREAAWPWVGAREAVHRVQVADSWHLLLSRWADVIAIVLAVAIVVVCVKLRKWPEAALLLLSAVPLVFSTQFLSAPRYLLTWFPIYVLLAQSSRSRPRLWAGLTALTAPLMFLTTYAWGAQWWIA